MGKLSKKDIEGMREFCPLAVNTAEQKRLFLKLYMKHWNQWINRE